MRLKQNNCEDQRGYTMDKSGCEAEDVLLNIKEGMYHIMHLKFSKIYEKKERSLLYNIIIITIQSMLLERKSHDIHFKTFRGGTPSF